MTLIPTNNNACSVFPPAVKINLTVGSSAVPQVLQTQVSNFNYTTITEIVFTIPQLDLNNNPINLNAYTDEQFAVLQIFSYSQMTQLELMVFDEMRSDLQNCFNYIAVNISENDISFLIQPTQSCLLQMVAYSV